MTAPEAIDTFILYLATERGLSDNYQLSTRRSLESFAGWLESQAKLTLAKVTPATITDYLAWRKRSGLAAASVKLEAVAIRIFFRFLHFRQIIPHDPAETSHSPHRALSARDPQRPRCREAHFRGRYPQ